MSIRLPADIEARIQQRVARGEFPDAGDVVREAMRLLDERDHQLEALRARLQSGLDHLDQGEGLAFTPELVEQMRRDADVRFRREERPNPDVVSYGDVRNVCHRERSEGSRLIVRNFRQSRDALLRSA